MQATYLGFSMYPNTRLGRSMALHDESRRIMIHHYLAPIKKRLAVEWRKMYDRDDYKGTTEVGRGVEYRVAQVVHG